MFRIPAFLFMQLQFYSSLDIFCPLALLDFFFLLLATALTLKWKKQHSETLAKTGGQPAALLTTSHENLLRFQSKQGQVFVFDKIKEEKMRGVLRTGQV